MEKKLHFHTDPELDKLIDLFAHPEELKMRVQTLKNSGTMLSDEVEGFIAFYEKHKGDVHTIEKKLALQEERITKQLTPKNNTLVIIRWAASLLIIIGSSLFFYLQNQSNKSKLNAVYEEIGIANYMAQNEKSDIKWNSIMYEYKSKQFQHIIDISNPTKNDTLFYFQGISAFKLSQFKNSIQFFNQIKKTSFFYNKSLYFKSIDLYNLQQINAFQKTISQIKPDKSDPDFNEKLDLLKRLK